MHLSEGGSHNSGRGSFSDFSIYPDNHPNMMRACEERDESETIRSRKKSAYKVFVRQHLTRGVRLDFPSTRVKASRPRIRMKLKE